MRNLLEYGYWPNAALKLFITQACNLSCPGCYNNSLSFKVATDRASCLAAEQILSAMKDAREAFNTYSVEFSGGEPTLSPDLPRMIAYAKSIGFITRIVTNGTILGAYGPFKKYLDRLLPPEIAIMTAEERIGLLLNSGLDRVLFSIDNMHTMPDKDFDPESAKTQKVPISVVTNAIKILLDNKKGYLKEKNDDNQIGRYGMCIGMTANNEDYLPSILLVKEVMASVGATPVLSENEVLPKRWVTADGQEIRLNRNETASIGRGSNMNLANFKTLADLYSRNCYDFVPRSRSPLR